MISANSKLDLKTAARSIDFFLKRGVSGDQAIASLCDLLTVTARLVREQEGCGTLLQRPDLPLDELTDSAPVNAAVYQ